ncbi:hypothetical protein [Clostridium luticellarii]|jgi:hypothetical protein|uniref:Uncharacterized protein n=1 Tax=Clostridium luticellarii TaxID=1691940 RepID=A0A2T0BQ95_9CLOT|nr:hypothetical protein [Clostridium luticellarii]MCI1944453.1 hypothetical protein [Clostridium luticellarii]MCI1967952.1 hypothetical protein [Clostridium luticellarii]MCI1995109.1 hypothetical protein [Clostridium luticellarii]MCI2039268.1 hypothetical protein [Clostridium luticellarii]PRR86048.1 hypothetical protein CLLU_08800 [Clostridium luticellarii]
MSKHHRNYNNGFNIADILNNIDIPQLLSIISSLGGNRNFSNDQLGSLMDNLNSSKGSQNTSAFNDSNIKSQLAALEDRLSKIESGGTIKEDLLQAIKELKNSPDAAKILNEYINSNDSRKNTHR